MIKLKSLLTELRRTLYKKNDWRKYNQLVKRGKSVSISTDRGGWFSWEEANNSGVIALDQDGGEVELRHNDIDYVEIY